MIKAEQRDMLRATSLFLFTTCATLIIGGSWFWYVQQAQAIDYPVTVRALILLINFTDNKATPISKAGAEAMFFSAPNSVASYYKANSFGRVNLTGDVAGWYSINRGGYTHCSTGYQAWRADALAAARAQGVVPENYQHVFYMFTGATCNTPGWGSYPFSFPSTNFALGAGNPPPLIGGTESYIWGYFHVAASAHEFGHNFGNGHADLSMVNDYGDLSDVMGNFWRVAGSVPLMYNAPRQINMEFVDSSGMKTVTSSGTYTINSLESNTGLRVLQIPKFNTPPHAHYVSMRQATGIDVNMPATYLNGANITLWSQGTANTLIEKVLADGTSWSDTANGIIVKQLSHTASTVTVQVTLAATGCVHYKPAVTTIPGSYYPQRFVVSPDSSTTFVINIRNNDTGACAPQAFTILSSTIYGALPSGWTATINPSPLSIAPGETGSTNFTVTLPSMPSVKTSPYTINYGIAYGTTTLAYQLSAYVESTSCTRAAPTFTAAIPKVTAAAGTAVPYTFTLKNNDNSSCGASTFTVAPVSLPSGWTVATPPPTYISPGSTVTLIATTTSPLGATGTTTVQMKAQDSSVSVHTASAPIEYGITENCVRAAPTLTSTPTEYSNGSGGTPKTYTLTVKNNDTAGCTASTFIPSVSVLPLNWAASPSAPNLTLAAGVSGSIIEIVTPPLSAPSGTTTVSITVVDTTVGIAHTANIPVQYGIPAICVRNAPTLTLSPSPQTANAGDQLVYNNTLTNTDTSICGGSTFDLDYEVPPGWSGNLSKTSVPLIPGVPSLITLTVLSPLGEPLGNYPISLGASSAGIPIHTVSTPATFIVGVVPPTLPLSSDLSISSTRVRSGESATLSWWVSNGLMVGVNCSVSPASMIKSGPTSIAGGGSVTSWGSPSNPITAQTTPIAGTVTFTLSCSDGTGASTVTSANATLIPVYQDL